MADNKEFTCARCGETFEKAWTDEEAATERKQNWPGWKEEDCDVICDDCHKVFMKWHKERTQ